MRTFLRARHLVIFGLLFALLFGIPAASHAQVAGCDYGGAAGVAGV